MSPRILNVFNKKGKRKRKETVPGIAVPEILDPLADVEEAESSDPAGRTTFPRPQTPTATTTAAEEEVIEGTLGGVYAFASVPVSNYETPVIPEQEGTEIEPSVRPVVPETVDLIEGGEVEPSADQSPEIPEIESVDGNVLIPVVPPDPVKIERPTEPVTGFEVETTVSGDLPSIPDISGYLLDASDPCADEDLSAEELQELHDVIDYIYGGTITPSVATPITPERFTPGWGSDPVLAPIPRKRDIDYSRQPRVVGYTVPYSICEVILTGESIHFDWTMEEEFGKDGVADVYAGGRVVTNTFGWENDTVPLRTVTIDDFELVFYGDKEKTDLITRSDPRYRIGDETLDEIVTFENFVANADGRTGTVDIIVNPTGITAEELMRNLEIYFVARIAFQVTDGSVQSEIYGWSVYPIDSGTDEPTDVDPIHGWISDPSHCPIEIPGKILERLRDEADKIGGVVPPVTCSIDEPTTGDNEIYGWTVYPTHFNRDSGTEAPIEEGEIYGWTVSPTHTPIEIPGEILDRLGDEVDRIGGVVPPIACSIDEPITGDNEIYGWSIYPPHSDTDEPEEEETVYGWTVYPAYCPIEIPGEILDRLQEQSEITGWILSPLAIPTEDEPESETPVHGWGIRPVLAPLPLRRDIDYSKEPQVAGHTVPFANLGAVPMYETEDEQEVTGWVLPPIAYTIQEAPIVEDSTYGFQVLPSMSPLGIPGVILEELQRQGKTIGWILPPIAAATQEQRRQEPEDLIESGLIVYPSVTREPIYESSIYGWEL